LGYGGGRGASIRVSLLNQDGGSGTGFRDRSGAVDESSNRAQVASRSDSFLLKTELIP